MKHFTQKNPPAGGSGCRGTCLKKASTRTCSCSLRRCSQHLKRKATRLLMSSCLLQGSHSRLTTYLFLQRFLPTSRALMACAMGCRSQAARNGRITRRRDIAASDQKCGEELCSVPIYSLPATTTLTLARLLSHAISCARK